MAENEKKDEDSERGEQRERLKAVLVPIVSEVLQEGLKPEIEEELRRSLLVSGRREEEQERIRKIFDSDDLRSIDEKRDNGIVVARIARCLAMASGDPERAARYAEKLYDDSLGGIVQKTLASNLADEGGVFVPAVLADTFIDALRAKAVVRAAGPVMIDLTGGNLRIPGIATDATAGWVGEGKKRNASNLKTRDLTFTAKTLQGKSAVTQALLRRASQSADAMIRDNLVRVMANEEDKAFLAGTGSAYEPRGMLDWAKAANKFAANATITLVNVSADLRTAVSKLTDNNVDLDRAVWFASYRTRNYLAFSLRDKEDRPLYQSELTARPSSLLGQPFFVTNNVPNTLGSGSDESRVYLANMASAFLAEEGGLRIRATNEGSFTDDTGASVSAFDQALMAIIIERDLDFIVAHDSSVAVITTVKWGS